MTQQIPEFQAVVERLEKLERQNRRLKRAGVLILASASAALLIGQILPKSRTVEAERFVLLDADGRKRAELALKEYGPGLFLYNANEKSQVSMVLATDGPYLYLADANEKPRVWLALLAYGPSFGFADANGIIRADLQLWSLLRDEPDPAFTFYDTGGKMRALLNLGLSGPYLAFYDANGKTLYTIP